MFMATQLVSRKIQLEVAAGKAQGTKTIPFIESTSRSDAKENKTGVYEPKLPKTFRLRRILHARVHGGVQLIHSKFVDLGFSLCHRN